MLDAQIIKTYRSSNFGERKDGKTPNMVILHYTGMESAQVALGWMCSEESQVSAHYMIDEDGAVYQLVDEDKRAWHAGVSEWQGESDINSVSIGIELVNPGHEFGYREFPQAQVDVLKALLRDIMARYDVVPERVLGHSDVAPGRKIDPGELFPWGDLEAEGLALRPC